MIVVAVANHKGGSGKTTVAINLAYAMSQLGGRRVLLVDLDPQGNAGVGLGIDVHDLSASAWDLFAPEPAKVEELAIPVRPNLHVIPSNLEAASLETDLISRLNRERILSQALSGNGQLPYDLVFLDTPPSLGLLTVNALVAADRVLVVVDCGFYALYGLRRLQGTIDLLRRSFQKKLPMSILVNGLDTRQNLDKDVVEEVRKSFGKAALQTVIHRNVKLKEAQSAGEPVLDYSKSSRGARDFAALAKEMGHLVGKRRRGDKNG